MRQDRTAVVDGYGASERTMAGTRVMQSEFLSWVSWRRLRRPLFLLGLYLADFLVPAVSFVAAYYLRYHAVPNAAPLSQILADSNTQFALLLVTVVHVFMIRQAGLYELHRTWLPLDFLLRVVSICTVSALLFPVVVGGHELALRSRILLVYLWLLLITLTLAGKLGARIVVLSMLCFGIGVKKVVVVGNNNTASRLWRTIHENPQLGYRVIGVAFRGQDTQGFADAVRKRPQTGPAFQTFGRLLDMCPDVVVIASSVHKNDEMLNLIAETTARGVEVRLVPEFHEVYTSNPVVDCVGLIPLVHLRSTKIPLPSAIFKRGTDIISALVLLPILGIVSLRLLPRARRAGVPLFDKSIRVGLNGGRFDLLRFNSALGPGETQARTDSPKAAWSAMLPQAVNLIRGEVSLVGPAAGDPDRAAHYSLWEKRMLAVRPGVLGCHGVNEVAGGETAAEQLEWDTAYLDQRSAAFDLNVVIAALPQLFLRQPGRADQCGD